MGTIFALSLVWLAGTADLDRDGVSDTLEQTLIEQFRPRFLVDTRECAHAPAEFEAFSVESRVRAHNAAIYARVSPSTLLGHDEPALQIHYCHLDGLRPTRLPRARRGARLRAPRAEREWLNGALLVRGSARRHRLRHEQRRTRRRYQRHLEWAAHLDLGRQARFLFEPGALPRTWVWRRPVS